jgi:NADH:ubiquinone oxidoreductase subunit 5 (subunit L)/multisubunit Na+/H+ antiporter MnhA subunit
MQAFVILFLGALAALAGPHALRRVVVVASGVAAWFIVVRHGDAVAVLIASATLFVGVVVTLFADRQFEGERRARTVTASALVVTGAATEVALAHGLVALAAWWCVTTVATAVLMVASGGLNVRTRVVRFLRAVGPADVLLFVVALWHSQAHLGPSDHSWQWRSAVWIVAWWAAAARAGALSLRSWVTDTVQAPTSLSALLHAGVVNGGAVLLVRLAPVVAPVAAVSWLAVAAGVAVLVRLAPRIHARVDLKGQLALSTVAQMTFMLVTVALGYPLLALTHVVGHGAYKAHRFVTAAAAIETRHRRVLYSPVGARLALAVRVAGVLIALGALVGLAAWLPWVARAPLGFAGVGAIALWWEGTDRALLCVAPLATTAAMLGLVYPLVVSGLGHAVHGLADTGLRAPWWGPALLVLALTPLTWGSRKLWSSPSAPAEVATAVAVAA